MDEHCHVRQGMLQKQVQKACASMALSRVHVHSTLPIEEGLNLDPKHNACLGFACGFSAPVFTGYHKSHNILIPFSHASASCGQQLIINGSKFSLSSPFRAFPLNAMQLTPGEILDCVAEGVDLFDGAYPVQVWTDVHSICAELLVGGVSTEK